MDPIRVWIEENTALVAFLSLLVAVAVPLLTWVVARFGGVTMREKLEDRASWDALIARFSGHAGEAYFAAVDRGLGFAERVYGPTPLSWQAFGRCFGVALAYPVLTLLAGWILFDVGEIGGATFFPAVEDPVGRA